MDTSLPVVVREVGLSDGLQSIARTLPTAQKIDAGVRGFDACIGGIGGCPHAPGASGNVATEDVASLFRSMGVPTGRDVAALLALRGRVGHWLEDEPLHGAIWRAGVPKTAKAAA